MIKVHERIELDAGATVTVTSGKRSAVIHGDTESVQTQIYFELPQLRRLAEVLVRAIEAMEACDE